MKKTYEFNYVELNIKEGMPRVMDAMDCLKDSIERFKRNKHKCVLVIHGYGSTGKGGAILKSAREWLLAQSKKGALKTVIFGEEFTIFNFKSLELKERYAELAPLIGGYNHGVTVVEL